MSLSISHYKAPLSRASLLNFHSKAGKRTILARVQTKILARAPCLFAHFDTQLHMVLSDALISGHSLPSEATTYLGEENEFALCSSR